MTYDLSKIAIGARRALSECGIPLSQGHGLEVAAGLFSYGTYRQYLEKPYTLPDPGYLIELLTQPFVVLDHRMAMRRLEEIKETRERPKPELEQIVSTFAIHAQQAAPETTFFDENDFIDRHILTAHKAAVLVCEPVRQVMAEIGVVCTVYEEVERDFYELTFSRGPDWRLEYGGHFRSPTSNGGEAENIPEVAFRATLLFPRLAPAMLGRAWTRISAWSHFPSDWRSADRGAPTYVGQF
ncbi:MULTISPECIES: hypothetical protein [Caballeronia]|uniref:hypothetical protein n=1 Tax=Caballeronia TaxID=1827195 RepID=UPI001FD4853C|nr:MULTISPECIES: hypothetical protein [Caballeronia]MDR5799063.1 hypothetical protein [Caballeronia sp. LZ001]